jgi:AmiR/NasT family two-component response regulator
MRIKVLFATPDQQSLDLLNSLLASAADLFCPEVEADSVNSRAALIERISTAVDDVVFVDWLMAESATPALVEDLVACNPKIRIVALLPLHYRQYRERVWDAGACNSIPKEHMDQEWLSSILCVMYRAMQREQKLRIELACVAPVAEMKGESDQQIVTPSLQGAVRGVING